MAFLIRDGKILLDLTTSPLFSVPLSEVIDPMSHPLSNRRDDAWHPLPPIRVESLDIIPALAQKLSLAANGTSETKPSSPVHLGDGCTIVASSASQGTKLLTGDAHGWF